jgi:2-polyprenyl-6-methoxyphenol hydroxylase-like FAD-dependent oxidoreductase
MHGVQAQRGVRVTGFEQDADGAHSAVRRAFEGAAFEEPYMLGDVEVDWSAPRGYGIRSTHETDDALVCIPLPGRGQYRMSMLVPDELTNGDTPQLHHIQAVLDRLSPEPTTARNLRWSSVFRISHRIVDAYGKGRVFVAGDAAHIHPPTGAQGMNTGIQDAHNLAWKLALAFSGHAAPGLLETYDAERRPVGEEVVRRTVVAPGKASAPTRPTSATSSAAKPSCSSTTRAARSSPEPLGRRHRAPTARVSVPRTRRA